jgi:hypothetical protein
MIDVDDGIHFDRLPKGARLVFQTLDREYFIEACGGMNARISGHPDYCPEPTLIAVRGSRRHGSKIQRGFIGRGMRFEFWHPTRGVISTSAVCEVRRVLHEESR